MRFSTPTALRVIAASLFVFQFIINLLDSLIGQKWPAAVAGL